MGSSSHAFPTGAREGHTNQERDENYNLITIDRQPTHLKTYTITAEGLTSIVADLDTYYCDRTLISYLPSEGYTSDEDEP